MDNITAQSHAAPYYYGWNIVVVTALCQAASFGVAINCLSLYIAAWSRDLDAPVSVLTLCYTFSGGFFCLLAPLAGAAADRISVRTMMTVGLVGVAALFALASRVTEAWQLIALFATLAPTSMIIAGYLPSQVLISRWFETRRGLAIGLSGMGLTVAGAVLPPIFAIVMPVIGWRNLFLVIAAVMAFACAPAALLVLRDRPKPGQGSELELRAGQPGSPAAAAVLTSRAILAQPNFWFLAAVYAIGNFMSAGVLVNLAPLASNRGLSGAQAASLLSAFSICTLVTKVTAGYAIDRIGGRFVMMAILLCAMAGDLILKLAGAYASVLLGIVLVAGCGAMMVPIAALVARQFGAANFGRAMGMVVVPSVVSVFAPPVVAFMREATRSYDAPLILLMAAGLVALLAAFLFRDHKPAPAP
jgi:MFS family permease